MEQNRHLSDPMENFLEILLTRKLLVVVGFMVVFAMTLVGVMKMPRMYEAYTTIFIKAPATSGASQLYNAEITGKYFLVNQVNIIQSRQILERVVRRLQLHRTPEEQEKSLKSRVKDEIYYYLKISRPIPDRVEAAIGGVRDSISVTSPRNSDIVVITTKTGSAEYSAVLANTVAEVYLEYARDLLTSITQSGYLFLEDEFVRASEGLREAESVLDEFNKGGMVFAMAAETSFIAQKLGELEEMGARNQAQLDSLKREGATNASSGENLTTLQYVNPEVKALEDELISLKAQLSNALLDLKEDHPDVKNIRNRIAKVEEKVKEAAANTGKGVNEQSPNGDGSLSIEIDKLEKEKAFLSGQIKKLLARRQELTEKGVTQERLAREVRRRRERVDLLQASLEEARALKAKGTELGSIKIVDRAFPPPFSIRRKKMILLAVGTMLGMIFGIGMAFIAEYLDDSLKTPDEAEEYLNLPVFGVVPKLTRKLEKAYVRVVRWKG